MSAAQYEPIRLADLLALLDGFEGGIVMFDIDNTLANGCLSDDPRFELREGGVEAVTGLLDLGFAVGFWSGGGAEHAHDVAVTMGVRARLIGCWGKPPYPMRLDAVEDLVGERPALTLDDDEGERIPGVQLLRVRPFWGSLVTAEELAEYEQQNLRKNA